MGYISGSSMSFMACFELFRFYFRPYRWIKVPFDKAGWPANVSHTDSHFPSPFLLPQKLGKKFRRSEKKFTML